MGTFSLNKEYITLKCPRPLSCFEPITKFKLSVSLHKDLKMSGGGAVALHFAPPTCI